MKKLTAMVTGLILVVSVGMMSGCGPRMARHLVGAAIVTAAVVGTAAVMAHHDDHQHYYRCGCPKHWRDGHWAYYYDGGWEYYDRRSGAWYRYQE